MVSCVSIYVRGHWVLGGGKLALRICDSRVQWLWCRVFIVTFIELVVQNTH